MKKYFRYIGPVFVTAIFVLAIYLLYNKLKTYSISQIRFSMEQISYFRIFISIILMVLNYIILIGYDWLAIKAIHKILPLLKVSMVSFIGQAVSYNFGALLGGTSVRYRFYSAWGFSISQIVRLVLMLAVTFWVGALGLCGIIFICSPPVIPGYLIQSMPIKDVRIFGIVLFSLACVYLVLCFAIRKSLNIFGKEFVFPSPSIAFAQCAVAGVDIIAAAGCMYILLPGNLGISFLEFLPSYLMAQVAVVLTHIPGGVGVFELVILELTHTPEEQAVFAAVLLFRLIYFIIPLLAATILLAVYEAKRRKNLFREAGRWISVLSHSISAYLVFVAGIILLVSTTLPTSSDNLVLIFNWIPKNVVGIGHFLCALSGALLLFVAYGLERRQAMGFRLALILLCIGSLGALFKGFAWETSIIIMIITMAICFAKRKFYRRTSFCNELLSPNWLFSAIVVIILIFLLGCFLYHPAWDKAASWGFERPFNASRTLKAFVGIICFLVIILWWQIWLRKQKINQKEN